MTKKTPAEVAEKWARKTAGATIDVKKGVENVTINPATLALAQEEKMVTNFNLAMADGKWSRAMQRVSLEDWRKAMINKGIPRMAQGAKEAQGKMEEFMREFLPFITAAQEEIHAMPSMTLEDNIERAVAWMRRLSGFQRS